VETKSRKIEVVKTKERRRKRRRGNEIRGEGTKEERK